MVCLRDRRLIMNNNRNHGEVFINSKIIWKPIVRVLLYVNGRRSRKVEPLQKWPTSLPPCVESRGNKQTYG